MNGDGRQPLVVRYAGNPILVADQWPHTVNAVFNPAAAELDGETLLLVRVEDRSSVWRRRATSARTYAPAC